MSMMKMEGGIIKQGAQAPIHSSEQHRADNLFLNEFGYNHLGTEDAIFNKTTTGVGTGTTIGHQMVLSTGIGAAGYASYYMALNGALSTHEFTYSFLPDLLANGAGVDRHTKVGLMQTPSAVPDTLDEAIFWQKADNTWVFICKNGGSSRQSAAFTVTTGDLLSIVAKSSKIEVYKNKNKIYTETNLTYIPTAPLYPGAAVVGTAATVSGARMFGVCFVSFRIIKR